MDFVKKKRVNDKKMQITLENILIAASAGEQPLFLTYCISRFLFVRMILSTRMYVQRFHH
jgi:hypothetical protein